MNIASLNNWSIVSSRTIYSKEDGSGVLRKFALPTQARLLAEGNITKQENEKRFDDGEFVHTGQLLSFTPKQIVTTRSIYNLLEPDREFMKWLHEQEYPLEQHNVKYRFFVKVPNTPIIAFASINGVLSWNVLVKDFEIDTYEVSLFLLKGAMLRIGEGFIWYGEEHDINRYNGENLENIVHYGE